MYGPIFEIVVLYVIVYVQKPPLNAHIAVSSAAKGLMFRVSIPVFQYF